MLRRREKLMRYISITTRSKATKHGKVATYVGGFHLSRNPSQVTKLFNHHHNAYYRQTWQGGSLY